MCFHKKSSIKTYFFHAKTHLLLCLGTLRGGNFQFFVYKVLNGYRVMNVVKLLMSIVTGECGFLSNKDKFKVNWEFC